jgi:hypothetical protein
MWGHLAARCPQAQRDRNVSPEHAAISLPLRKQGKDEAQRSIRTFYEAVTVKRHKSNSNLSLSWVGVRGFFTKPSFLIDFRGAIK